LKGGTYTDSDMIEYYEHLNGTAANPITFKNYPGETPIIAAATPDDYVFAFRYCKNFMFEGIIIRPDSFTRNILQIHDSTNITVRNVEIDGSLAHGRGEGIHLNNVNYFTLEDSYIHDIYYPTGDECDMFNVCGDGSDQGQGNSNGLFAAYSNFMLIKNNRIERCNHAAINLERSSNYNKIINNSIDARYGGGIYVVDQSSYNLIEGNIITHPGGTTTKTKEGIYIAASHNTIRKNIVYGPSQNGAIGLKGDTFDGRAYNTTYNLIYNNLFFGSGNGFSATIVVDNRENPDIGVYNNYFANNMFYNTTGTYKDSGTNSDIIIETYNANFENNWLEPDDISTNLSSTHWGGNKWYNNLIRSYGISDNPNSIMWARDKDLNGGWFAYSVSNAENEDPVAWANNIEEDPLLVSTEPDDYGLFNNWWHIQSGSPAIDAGIPVHDTNGEYVENLYPGWGWGDLPYNGDAPDIGAYEYAA